MPTTSSVCCCTNILPPQHPLTCSNCVDCSTPHTSYMCALSVHPLPSLWSISSFAVSPAGLPPHCDSTVNLTPYPHPLQTPPSHQNIWQTLPFPPVKNTAFRMTGSQSFSRWLVFIWDLTTHHCSDHPSHLNLLSGCNEASGSQYRALSVFWGVLYFCISVFLLCRLDHNGIGGRAAGDGRSGEIFEGIRRKQPSRLIYRRARIPPAKIDPRPGRH